MTCIIHKVQNKLVQYILRPPNYFAKEKETKEKKCVIYFVHACTSKKKYKANSLKRQKVYIYKKKKVVRSDRYSHAFRHLPPNSAGFSYATEGALFISAQLNFPQRGPHPPKGFGTDKTVEATKHPSMHVNLRRIYSRLKKGSVSIQTILVLF